MPERTSRAWPLEMQPGDLVVFNHRIKHASFGGGTRRRMFTINLQQRFREEDEALLRECIASLAGFWYERVYAPTWWRPRTRPACATSNSALPMPTTCPAWSPRHAGK